jgi:hypothetical protein
LEKRLAVVETCEQRNATTVKKVASGYEEAVAETWQQVVPTTYAKKKNLWRLDDRDPREM